MITYESYIVGGVPVADVTCDQLGIICREALAHKKQTVAFSMNGEGISYYNTDSEFKSLIERADIIHADGWSTMMAGRLLTGGEYSERVATTDAYAQMLDAAISESAGVFLLGGKADVVRATADSLEKSFPRLDIRGYRDGYFEQDNIQSIAEEINSTGASMVFIGLGRPLQEKVALNLKELCPNVYWFKTCGGLFDFLSGDKPRAPVWMQNIGLEWLYRLGNDPRRLFYRYFWTNLYSIYAYILKRR